VNQLNSTAGIGAARMYRDASIISREVVQHLVSLLTANVVVTLEIQATILEGVPENVVRMACKRELRDSELYNPRRRKGIGAGSLCLLRYRAF
jgi:hypothetical protein